MIQYQVTRCLLFGSALLFWGTSLIAAISVATLAVDVHTLRLWGEEQGKEREGDGEERFRFCGEGERLVERLVMAGQSS